MKVSGLTSQTMMMTAAAAMMMMAPEQPLSSIPLEYILHSSIHLI